MQLQTFMLGIDVARHALLLISTPPFRYFRHGEACAKDKNLYPVWSDDTIWKMLGQLCSRNSPELTLGLFSFPAEFCTERSIILSYSVGERTRIFTQTASQSQ